MRGALACLTVWAAGCASLGAPGPVAADRPGFSDGTVALPPRALQLEAGVLDDRLGAAAGSPRTEYVALGQTLLRAGVGYRTEVRVFGNSYATRMTDGSSTVHGAEDLKLGAKVNLHSLPDSVHAVFPTLALLLATTLPTGSRGFSAGSAQPEAKVAANWITSTPLSISAEAGLNALQTPNGRATQTSTSLAGWWAMSPSVSAFVEGLLVRSASGSAAGANEIDFGATYLVNQRLQIDASVGHGVGPSTAHEHFVDIGIAKRW